MNWLYSTLTLFLLQSILFLCVVLFTVTITYISHKGLLGSRIKKILSVNSKVELFLTIVIVSGFIMLFLNLFLMFNQYLLYFNSGWIDYSFVKEANTSTDNDPVRYWPSGVAQSWSIIGTAALAYRITPGTPRNKVIVAMASMSITLPTNVFTAAVENPNGFNKLLFSWSHLKKTGEWPSPATLKNVTEESVTKIITENSPEEGAKLSAVTNKFLPSNFNDFFQDLLQSISPETLFYKFMGLFKPVAVEGFLDDLIGQQLLIHFLLISIVIGLIIFFSFYLILITVYINREFILKKFENRYILWYIKYQLILTKISLVIIPCFIFFGLIELFVGLYFLITRPVPIDQLPIDLHIYINK